MAWKDRVEALRKLVEWECKDIAPDLVLAIINNESGGQVGIQGRVKTKAGVVYDVAGNPHTVNHAMGLMQVLTSVVDWYNEDAVDDDKATFEDLIGDDERAARIQIRIGCKFLAFVNHYLHQNFPAAAPSANLATANPDQIKLVLTAYAVGHGNTAKKLKALKAAGKPMTFAAIKQNYPDWGKNAAGKWINRPLFYADKVFSNFQKNSRGKSIFPDPTEIVKRSAKSVDVKGVFLAAAFLAGASWMINKYYTKPRPIDENP